MYPSMGQFVHYPPPASLCTAAEDGIEGAQHTGPTDTCCWGSKERAVPQTAAQPN